MADSEQKPPQQPSYRPPSSIDPAELAAAFEKEGLAAPKPAEAQPAATPSPSEPTKAEQPKGEEAPQLLKIAQERAALRREKEQVAPYLDAFKVFSPQEAQRLAQARAAGNPVAALAALGFTHAQYTQALLGEKSEPAQETQTEQPSQENSKLSQLEAELRALKAERENERVQTNRQQALSKMKEVLSADGKFKHVNGLENYAAVESVLTAYWAEHREMPGATFEESVRMAAEVVEANLAKEAEKWSKVLTVSQNPAPMSAQKAPESQPSTGTATPRMLTNAVATAPAEVKTAPKTRQELINAFIERGEEALT